MYPGQLERLALGQSVGLGTLYDARSDKFLPQCLLPDNHPEDAIFTQPIGNSHIAISTSDSYEAKVTILGAGRDLALSIMANLLDLEGSSSYLGQEPSESTSYAYRAACLSVETASEALNFSTGNLDYCLDLQKLQTSPATHVVAEITKGAQAVIEARLCGHGRDADETGQRNLQSLFSSLHLEHNGEHVEVTLMEAELVSSLKVYSDLGFSYSGKVDSVRRHVEQMLGLARGQHVELSVPTRYLLLPAQFFSDFFDVPVSLTAEVHFVSQYQYGAALVVTDRIRTTKTRLESYYARIKANRAAIPAEHLVDVADQLQQVCKCESDFQSQFSRYLKASRESRAQFAALQDFLDGFMNDHNELQVGRVVREDYMKKLDLIESFTAQGARYVSTNDMLAKTLQSVSQGISYALFFDLQAASKEDWASHYRFASQQLAARIPVIVVDCDAMGIEIDDGRVSKFENGKMTIRDVVAEIRRLAELSLIQYDPSRIDRTVLTAPAQRKAVSMRCPNNACDTAVREWVCVECQVKVEYASVDEHIYCDCGRISYKHVAFNCQRRSHGSAFTRSPPSQVLKLLNKLPTPPEINILILGETGVGKSTFINAFINYLTFSSLDQALSARELNWIIPCSFATQYDDPHTGELIEKTVKIGMDEDENDGSTGQSATQKATVYPLYTDGKLVRLIDTPGIGDTRGPEQDRENLVNVLSVLRNYQDLHGILMLLKPNNARLTVMFKFCVTELLGQLHRTAAENMVFGFTNTRGSNYQPGDTYGPLRELLSEYKDVIRGLHRDTVFCFDSESFRYLAARRKGIDMGNLEDYRRSWDHSHTAARRLLARFQSLKPHPVRSTVSLNETRYLISQLIQPMANVSSAINDSVTKSKKQIKDLSNTRLTGAELRKKLKIEKVVVQSKELDRPITVCSHESCVSYQADPGQGGRTVTLHKSLCHNPCCLTAVPPDRIGVPEVSHCAAFSMGTCRVCGHIWNHHQHIIVEYSVSSETSTDPDVERALTRNGDEVQAKEAQIKTLSKIITELEREHTQIQEAQARFSQYLKAHSITHFNDATLEYYDHLIKDEKSKAGFGDRDSLARLQRLQEDKAKYQQFVDAMRSGSSGYRRYKPLDENGVQTLVASLYSMPHYGKNLKDVADKVGRAYAATFRERPYRVRGFRYWQSEAATGSSQLKLFETKPTRDIQLRSKQDVNPGRRSSKQDVNPVRWSLKKSLLEVGEQSGPSARQPPQPPPAPVHMRKDDDEEWWENDDTQTGGHISRGAFYIEPPVQEPPAVEQFYQTGSSAPLRKHTLRKPTPSAVIQEFQPKEHFDMPPSYHDARPSGFRRGTHNNAVMAGYGPPVPVAANWDGATAPKRQSGSWLKSVKSKTVGKLKRMSS